MSEFYCPSCGKWKPEDQKSPIKSSTLYKCMSCVKAGPRKAKRPRKLTSDRKEYAASRLSHHDEGKEFDPVEVRSVSEFFGR